MYTLHDQPMSQPLSITRIALSQAEKDKEYPLYYPAQLPEGFQHDPTTVIIQDVFVSFSITSSVGSTLTVTQQQRPPLMERVQLVGESSKNNLEPGRYVANLEGNYTGLILTDKTLVMISGSEKAELQQLKQLLDSFEKV